MNARSTLLQWLSKSELQRTLDGLDLLCRRHADAQRGAETALLSGRHHHLLEQQREGTIAQADYLTERARISKALMDLVQNLPPDWSAEPLAQVPPTPAAAAPAAAGGKSFLEKWGLIIGILAGVAGITGLTLKDVFFPKKTDPATAQQPAAAGQKLPETTSPAATASENKTTQPVDSQSKKPTKHSSGNSSVQQQPKNDVAQPPVTNPQREANSPPSGGLGGTAKPGLPASTGKFRSFAPSRIIEGMERGKVDGEFAFLNHTTRQVLCCYEDAEDFSGGKAYVKQRGRYFYIDKAGREVE